MEPRNEEPSADVAPHKRGWAAIRDSDDKSGCDARVMTQLVAKQRRRRQRRNRRGEVVKLTIRGFPLTFPLCPGPKVMVPVDGPWIQSMVSDLITRKKEAPEASSQAPDGMRLHMTEVDKGRLSWRGPSGKSPASWIVKYMDHQGRAKVSRAGLTVPRVSLAGENEEGVIKAALQVLQKARRAWNRLDQPGAERYVF